MSESRVLRGTFEPKTEKQREGGAHYIIRSFIFCVLRKVLGDKMKDEMGKTNTRGGGGDECDQHFGRKT
jgi:hypothetical protein